MSIASFTPHKTVTQQKNQYLSSFFRRTQQRWDIPPIVFFPPYTATRKRNDISARIWRDVFSCRQLTFCLAYDLLLDIPPPPPLFQVPDQTKRWKNTQAPSLKEEYFQANVVTPLHSMSVPFLQNRNTKADKLKLLTWIVNG